MNSKILVTGASGFLGKQVTHDLVHQGHELVTLERTPVSGVTGTARKKIYSTVTALFREQPRFDVIYHLAAYIPRPGSAENGNELTASNVELTLQLVNHYPDAKIIFASSVSVYGIPVELPITEQSPFNQPDAYGLSKLAGESIVRGCPRFSVIRFTSLIGVAMTMRTFVRRIVEDARSIGTITLLGDGSRRQNYLDVRDAAALCLLTAELEDNHIVNGVAGASFSNREVASEAAEICNASIQYTGSDNSPSFVYAVGESHKKINFVPKIPLRQTIREMIDHG